MKRKVASRNIFIGASILAFAGIFSSAIGAIYKIPLTNILGANGMGVYYLVFPFYSLLLVLSSSGIGTAVSTLIAKERAQNCRKNEIIIFKVACTNTNYIPLAKKKPSIGEKVYAIGSPRGLENTFSSGEVSQWRDTYLMQISALIDHGSSGGALINEYGEVVGITSGTFYDGSQANLNYAWSIDVVKPYIKWYENESY